VKDHLARAPVILVAALLMIGGVYRIRDQSANSEGTALLVAGLIVLGVWVGAEAVALHKRMHDDKKGDDDGGT
jgi:hypothetical protein